MKPQTEELLKLLEVDQEQRDDSWEEDFFNAFAHSKVSVVSEEPIVGPDGWPYIIVKSEKEANESVPKLMEWLSDKGIGLVLNVDKEAPDYVFSYGMIWNYRETGHFIEDIDEDVQDGLIEFEEGQEILAGPPTEEYLPEYSRSIFKQFLSDQKISDSRILVISPDEKHFDLCFSLESLGNPPEEEHEGILEAFSWFFPLHYSLMLASEEGLPEFYSL